MQRMVLRRMAFVLMLFSACSEESFTSESDAGVVATDSGDGATASLTGLAVVSPACGTDTQGRTAECRACAEQQCAVELAECFGATYTTTLAGGLCQTFGQCVMACSCGDQVCYQACVEAQSTTGPAACTDCLTRLLACETTQCSEICAGSTSAGEDAGSVDGGPTDGAPDRGR
jgi:hypothetical protein